MTKKNQAAFDMMNKNKNNAQHGQAGAKTSVNTSSQAKSNQTRSTRQTSRGI